MINSVLVPIVYLPVQLPTTFELIINLKRRMPSNQSFRPHCSPAALLLRLRQPVQGG